MTAANSTISKSGTKLVIGLVAFAAVLVIISRVYRTPPQDAHEALQQQGILAARRGMDLSREGKKLLPVEEQREMDALYAAALQTLTPTESQQFLTLAQKGTAATDREVTESGELIQKALRALPREKSERLWVLVEKAVQLQLAQQNARP